MTEKKISVEREDLSSVKKRLKITVPEEVVTREFKDAYRKLRSTAAISGFRKGNVPMGVLKARFGEGVTHDVATKLLEISYSDALEETALAPLVKPDMDVDLNKLEEGRDFTYTVTFEVTPTIEIDGYKELGFEKQGEQEVTEEDIQEAFKRLQEANIQFMEVDRPAQKGDLVEVDFEAERNGKTFKDLKAEAYPVMVGESGPMPGFAEAVEGLVKGDKKDLTITIPENYHNKKVAGKDVVFHIAVKAVKVKTLPALDDVFAKNLEFDSLEKLKERIIEDLGKAKENHQKEELKTKILDKLIEANPFDVPDVMVERYLTLILGNIVDNMRSGMGSPEDQKLNPEALKKKYRPLAVRRVLEDVVLDSIASKENIEVTREETEDAVKQLAASRDIPFESLMQRVVREGSLEVIKDGLKHEKVFDIIIETFKASE
ncbi:MAG: trigger factor [Thermodesulfobacteriota bacterium]|nr:MAG: trigger factor [Thermodesulfobacteriota bacterium]